MEFEDWLKPAAELRGCCRVCETPYLNAADEDGVLVDSDLPEGERLPGFAPLRLIADEEDSHSLVLGEWCSVECFCHDVSALAESLCHHTSADTPATLAEWTHDGETPANRDPPLSPE